MAHNGNITNYDELATGLRERSIHLLSSCDVEPVLCELADALMQRRRCGHTVDDAVWAARTVLQKVRGAYSVVAAMRLDSQPTLMVLRDENGIRPATVGRHADGSWLVASETVALDVLDCERSFDPEPGEVVFLRAGREPLRHQLRPSCPAPCVFERVYFARPDSNIDGSSVYESRLALGRALAERIDRKKLDIDVVVPVPDTARPAATAIAECLGVPQREGLIKNRYSGRTFIMPDQLTRRTALRLKLNPLPGEIRGRQILLVDDSIVRGTTLGRVIRMVREAGADAVHLAIHSPPVRYPCFYGIDISTKDELFASRFDGGLDALEQRAAVELQADSLTYLPMNDLNRAIDGPRCAACFDGNYPQAISARERATIAEDRRLRESDLTAACS